MSLQKITKDTPWTLNFSSFS
ncbi:hypothetical protein AZE42_12486 [Rhizopogon vesiculosus]|uniref:Uncharacterized protein n=1 Tax=Rhizopogon vesiculosus TaxID=180088 RepID=A0A1J8PWX0_9AGAM|nr:hypothetical protein AZE42_12486 [Rhizopogon vesiculosus]